MKEQLEKEGQAVKDQLLRDSELRKKENDALKAKLEQDKQELLEENEKVKAHIDGETQHLKSQLEQARITLLHGLQSYIGPTNCGQIWRLFFLPW